MIWTENSPNTAQKVVVTSAPSSIQSQRTLDSMVNLQQPQQQLLHSELAQRFKQPLNNLLILDWLVCSNLPFTIVDDPRWRRQQLYNNPLIDERDLPHTRTITRLLMAEYQRAVPKIKELLRTARGMIHLTFDGWTSRRFTSFVGIHAHFIDRNFKRWVLLLGLPALVKRHTGSDVADEVLAIIRFFEIEDRVGYCTLDNESKNGITMVKIGQQLGFDGEERQISCAPHALQLAVRALLYGDGCKHLPLDEVLQNWLRDSFADEDEETRALEEAFGVEDSNLEDESDREDSDVEAGDEEDDSESSADSFISSSDTTETNSQEEFNLPEDQIEAASQAFNYPAPTQLNTRSMARYQKKGPFGKLHNHGNCFHRSSQLVGAFHKAQKDVDPSAVIKEWVHNGATRWQSDEAMAARALLLQPAIRRLYSNLEEQWEADGQKAKDKPQLLEFRLGRQDWFVVEAIQSILEPFKMASKKLQGNGPAGALDQYFPQMELLLLHLEDCGRGNCYREREDPDHPAGPPIQENVKLFANLDQQERRFLKAYIRVGLWKLQRYYDKLTNLAYAAAVIFNPSLKMTGLQGIFDAEPQRQQGAWREDYLRRLKACWVDNYKNRCVLAGEKSLWDPTNLSEGLQTHKPTPKTNIKLFSRYFNAANDSTPPTTPTRFLIPKTHKIHSHLPREGKGRARIPSRGRPTTRIRYRTSSSNTYQSL